MELYLITWDDHKNEINKKKHGLSFESASLIFEDPLHVTRLERIEGYEQRYQTIGQVGGLLLILVAHTWTELDSGKSISVLSQQDELPRSREASMSKISDDIKKELAALSNKSEGDIDFSDIPKTTSDNWKGATRGQFYRPIKKQLTVRLDADILEWLKSQGKGYQSRLNGILRDAMIRDYTEHNNHHPPK